MTGCPVPYTIDGRSSDSSSPNQMCRCYRISMDFLLPEESELRGQWLLVNGNVVEDDACRRIQSLVSGLDRISMSNDGWKKLFRDPRDGRYWELLYLESEMHGGGPPTLKVVSEPSSWR